jgi:hypothetical protein
MVLKKTLIPAIYCACYNEIPSIMSAYCRICLAIKEEE